ncbi:hypothetical protein [Trueperella sp. LYQ143]|uniref:hypothetical protein n=1 Tax=Trueperella sp. LYQ143 TaxID=3391059 RepID=UPI0039833BAD
MQKFIWCSRRACTVREIDVQEIEEWKRNWQRNYLADCRERAGRGRAFHVTAEMNKLSDVRSRKNHYS